jgi:hypothetical protein
MLKRRKIIKFTYRLLLGIIALFFLLLILINLPGVQGFLSRQVASYLSKRLNTEVSVKGVYWKLPKYISIKDVYVEDQQKDTLLWTKELRSDIGLGKIFQKEIAIKDVLLRDAKIDVHPTAQGSNLDFILEAFAGDSTQAEKPPKEPAKNPWTITFPDTKLLLQDIDAYYEMGQQAYDIGVDQLSAQAKNIQLDSNLFLMDQISLQDTKAFIKMGPVADTLPTPTDTSTLTAFRIGSRKIDFENIEFGLSMPEMELSTTIGLLSTDSATMYLGNRMDIDVLSFLLKESRFEYDVPGTPEIEGFDPNHFTLENIEMDIQDATYRDLDIYATINQLAANEPKGIELTNLSAQVHYNLDTAEIRQLKMATALSSIEASNTLVTFPFITSDAPMGAMQLKSDVEKGRFHPNDAIFFAPMLKDFFFVQQNKNRPVAVRANIDGTLNNLRIKQLDVRAWDSHVNLYGRLTNPLDLDRTTLDFKANVIEASQQGVLNWLPPNTLPEYMGLPESILAKASIKGPLNTLDFNIEALTTSSTEPISSKLKANGQLLNVLDTENLQYKATIDTLFTSKAGLLTLIPADALPTYLDLPPEVMLKGKLEGSLERIDTDFKLYAMRGGNFSYLSATGVITEFSSGRDPEFDITINELDLKPEEILAFLPKGILPPYIKIPSISNAQGFIKGKQNNFNSDILISTTAGQLKAKGFLRDSTYEMEVDLSAFDLESLFTEGEYEEMIGIPLSKFGVSLKVNGNGFDPKKNLLANYRIAINPNNELYDWKEGLVIEGQVDRQYVTSKLSINEDQVKATGSSIADFNQPNENFEMELDLQKLDFYRLRLTALPFDIKGLLNIESTGSDLSQLNGKIRAQDWEIRYDSLTETMDSLLLTARLDTNMNKIGIQSDVIYGNIDGKFEFDKIGVQLQQQMMSYFDPNSEKQDTLSAEENAYFNFLLEIDDPSILTMGYVPGLKKIAPCFMLGSFNAKDKLLKFYSEVPSLEYSEYEILDLFFFFSSTRESLNYELNFSDIFLYDQFQIHNANFTGNASGGLLTTRLNQRDSSFVERFNIEAQVYNLQDQFKINIDPKLVLNYQDWYIQESNELLYKKDTIRAKDWKISYEDQSLELVTDEITTDRLDVQFQRFDLDFISDLIKKDAGYFAGRMDGLVQARDIFKGFGVNTDLTVEDLKVMDALLGQLEAKVDYDSTQLADIDTRLVGYGNDFALKGQYQPDTLNDDLNLELIVNNVQLDNLRPALEEYVSLLKGDLSGAMTIKGETDAPVIDGQLNLQNSSIRPNILQTRFDINSATMAFTNEGISIPAFELKDSLGQKATFSGDILTFNYQDFGMVLNFDAENFLLLNTKREDNDLYFGTLVADLSTEIIGDFENPSISVDIKTERGSDITYIYSYGGLQSLESGVGIVEFVTRDTIGQEVDEERLLEEIQSGYGFDIAVNAEVTDDLKITVITDEIAGDNFVGKGEGVISLRMFPNNDIEMTGEVKLIEGDYLFTYSDVLRRRFQVKPGGTVNFLGDPYNPQMRITATYTTKTSPYPLVVSILGGEGNISEADRQEWEDNLQNNETFIAEISVVGPLKEIDITTDITYPRITSNSNNEAVNDALSRLKEDPSQTNTQAFSLILFNGFIAEDIGSDKNFLSVDVQGGLSSLITGQLNNLANRYITFVDLDFGIESAAGGEGALFEETDFRVSLRKTFLDDRLSISVDGVATNRSNANQSSQAYLDNIAVEYSLTKRGNLKVKVFNQREMDDVFTGEVVKLGGALVFSKEFNRINLFNKRKN